MTEQFTPGPWRVSEAAPTKTRGIDILAGYQKVVAHVPVSPEYIANRTHDEDARLIAAAPELYEALVDLLNWQRRNGLESGKPIAERALAVVAKARGEQVSA